MRLRLGDATATAVTTGTEVLTGSPVRQPAINIDAVNSHNSGHEPNCERRLVSPIRVLLKRRRYAGPNGSGDRPILRFPHLSRMTRD